MIAAGNTVAVGVDATARRSVLIAELSTRPIAIARLRVFTEG